MPNGEIHIGIELFADEAPDLERAVQFVGAMPGAVIRPDMSTRNYLYHESASMYGFIHLSLADASGLGELGKSVDRRAVVMLREELLTRMCPRQIVYIGVDGAVPQYLLTYLAREVPRLMGSAQHWAAVIVPCIGERERAHLVAGRGDLTQRLGEAAGMFTTA